MRASLWFCCDGLRAEMKATTLNERRRNQGFFLVTGRRLQGQCRCVALAEEDDSNCALAAEEKGFEPLDDLRHRRFSKPLPSTTRPPSMLFARLCPIPTLSSTPPSRPLQGGLKPGGRDAQIAVDATAARTVPGRDVRYAAEPAGLRAAPRAVSPADADPSQSPPADA